MWFNSGAVYVGIVMLARLGAGAIDRLFYGFA